MAHQTAAYYPTKSFSKTRKDKKKLVHGNILPEMSLQDTDLAFPSALHFHTQHHHTWLGKPIYCTEAPRQGGDQI